MQISEKDAIHFVELLTVENDRLKKELEMYKADGMFTYFKKQLDDADNKIAEYEDTIQHLRRELSGVYDKLAKLEDEVEELKCQ